MAGTIDDWSCVLRALTDCVGCARLVATDRSECLHCPLRKLETLVRCRKALMRCVRSVGACPTQAELDGALRAHEALDVLVRWMRTHDFDCRLWDEERMYFEACMLHVRRVAGVESPWREYVAWCAV